MGILKRGSLQTNRVPGGETQGAEYFLIMHLTLGQGPSTHKTSVGAHTCNISILGVEAGSPRSRSPSAAEVNLSTRKSCLKKQAGNDIA